VARIRTANGINEGNRHATARLICDLCEIAAPGKKPAQLHPLWAQVFKMAEERGRENG
jgi:hypothetical protein